MYTRVEVTNSVPNLRVKVKDNRNNRIVQVLNESKAGKRVCFDFGSSGARRKTIDLLPGEQRYFKIDLSIQKVSVSLGD